MAKRTISENPQPWAALRLRDRIRPGLQILFVGINPGVRSATTGHHFAGFSNRFWKLLFESGLVPEPVTSLVQASTTSDPPSTSKAGKSSSGKSGATGQRSSRSWA
jgi:mismatch-specific thymine-DNA glycosylase